MAAIVRGAGGTELKAVSRDLGEVVKKIEDSSLKIQKIAEGVAGAAKALTILADLAARAATIM